MASTGFSTYSETVDVADDARSSLGKLALLPIEIREHIWHCVFRPDLVSFACGMAHPKWSNAVGCTKVLVLSRRIYSEAMRVLEKADNIILLRGTGNTIFRHPLANGKPNFFHAEAKTSSADFPTGLSMLEMMGLRKINIWIQYGDSIQGTRHEIQELSKATSLSRTLKEVNLHIRYYCASLLQYHKHKLQEQIETERKSIRETVHAIRPFLDLAIQKHIFLTATEHKWFKVGIHQRRRYFENYRDPLVTFVNQYKPLRASNAAISVEMEAYKNLSSREKSNDRCFTLTPECRKCFKIFSKEDLVEHLRQLPSHKMLFVKQRYNTIHRFAISGGSRHPCFVCGRSYHSRAYLDNHIKMEGHYRNPEMGIVGRYVKDNDSVKSSSLSGPREWLD